MIKIKKKAFIVSIIALIILSAVAFANSYEKYVTIYTGNFNILLDGKVLSFSSEPIIYNGITYAPVKDLANHLGSNVSWDSFNRNVNIYSQYTSSYDNTSTISALREEVKKLQNNNSNYSSSSSDDDDDDLDDLKDTLEDDYDQYRDGSDRMDFDKVKVSQSSSKVTIKMYGDFKRTDSEWKDRSKSSFRDWVEDICEESVDVIRKDVQVYIYDSNDRQIGKYSYDRKDEELDVDDEY